MREVRYTTRFRRDYRREKSGRHGKRIDALLMAIVNLLAADQPLPSHNVDHPLSGEWEDFRDCHLRPDLILIYRKTDDNGLELVPLGSHSELGWRWAVANEASEGARFTRSDGLAASDCGLQQCITDGNHILADDDEIAVLLRNDAQEI